MKSVTVVGARGMLGSEVLAQARALGLETAGCRHDEISAIASLGTVIYCSGLTWGAERRPLDAFRIGVAPLFELAGRPDCERVVFVSSTRVYERSASTSEDAPVTANPANPREAYVLSKLAGESIVLASSDNNRVVRLSSLAGPNLRSELILCDVLRQATRTGRVALRTSIESSKDYVALGDAARMLLAIAASSRERVYNVATGHNVTHRELLAAIAARAPFELDVPAGAPVVSLAPIDIGRVQTEFGFRASDVLANLAPTIDAFIGDAESARRESHV